MKKAENYSRAVKLRRQGFSLNEISKVINISKSTASKWLFGIKMSKKGEDRIMKIKKDAINKSRATIKQKKQNSIRKIEKQCHVLKNGFKSDRDEYKLMMALLYWCEGSKGGSRVIFMNSDPDLIRLYLKLFRSSFDIEDGKLSAILHLHSYHQSQEQIKYWSKITGIFTKNIKIYQKKNSGSRKKENYQGCISIRYGNVEILEEIKIIIGRIIKLSNAGVG